MFTSRPVEPPCDRLAEPACGAREDRDAAHSTSTWILCFACDRGAYPGATVVWEDPEEGLAILRRAT